MLYAHIISSTPYVGMIGQRSLNYSTTFYNGHSQ